ncbi:hypothetical protein AB6A40_009604 [Gnathostoma spinigerum]|uniref:Uncharacterized protein n=1 Tax=Gnathostoma spinigerum TaxID=75299 RepID=A0ABD6ESF6_9BILA
MASRKAVKAVKAVYGSGLVASGALVSNSKLTSSPHSCLELRTPTRIAYCNSKEIRHIAAGFGFSVFASRDRIYGSGLDIFTNSLDTDGWWQNGRRLMLSKLSGPIIGIAAGRRHFLVATSKQVCAFGDNAHGQCGCDPCKIQFLRPDLNGCVFIDVPTDSEIKQVHCTLDSSFVVTKSGEVFSFGLGTDGQLGRGDEGFDWKCRQVEGDIKSEKIEHLRGSTDTLMGVSSHGDLFMWGQNEYGQMAPFYKQMQVKVSRRIKLDIGALAMADSTGTSCIVLNKEGHVYVWGYGVLGFGPNIPSLARPSRLSSNLFANSPDEKGSVEKIFAGNTAMAAITTEGSLYTWGINRFSHLALGHSNDQFFPYQVCLSRNAVSVSLAPDHSLFLLS